MSASLYGRLIGVGLLLAALAGLYGWGHHRGASSVQARWDAQRIAQQVALAASQAKAASVTERVVTKYVDRVQVIHERARTLIQKVPVYVSATADARCPVPAGFVRLHDAAVQGGELPAAAGSTDDAPSGIALSTVASTVAGNYATGHETAERLKALQAWVMAQHKAATSKP